MDSNIGKKLDGRYELLELIGVGGMADIYKARDIEEDRIVAVKILKTEFAGSDEFLRRFRNESKAIALLSHPNIVKIYDVGFTDKVQFIVMEYVDGITLTDYIEQQGVLKWRDAVHFTIQILKALQHAHDRGIVHRDIKSSNVMLLSDGTIKVMDFGIARFNRENNKTMSEKTIGSVHYISPEQARGDITDERSDIYSVGVALYEMLTGKKPFDGDTPVAIALMHMQSTPKKPSEINSTIAEGLEQIVLRAMQKDPAQRYQTAGEMIKDLEEFRKNPGIVFDYKYNSTDGTTKYFDRPIPAAEQERTRRRQQVQEEPDYDDEDDDDYDDDEDEYEERRSPLIPILFAVGTAFVIATVFLVLLIVFRNLDVSGEDVKSVMGVSDASDISVTDDNTFLMPNLVGMSWEEANQKYSKYMKLKAEQEWSTVAKDQIFDQEYAEGRKVKTGVEVTVKVSKGIRQVEIQDLENLSLSIAETKLEKDGFVVKKTYLESDDVPKDMVIRTEPAAHEMADQGSTVVLVVSLGPKDTQVVVPKFVTLPLSVAIQRADEYHLKYQVEYKGSDEYDEDVVMEQSIEPNSRVDRDTEIVFTVSTGKPDEKTKTLKYTLPKKAEGEFRFNYYIDGVLDPDAEVVMDIGLASSKSMKYDVVGKPGETKKVTIKVTSVETGKTGIYMDITVTFPEDDSKPKAEEEVNSKIFSELLIADESDEPIFETSEVEPGTTDTTETEPEPAETTAHTTARTEPEEPTEPDPGISVN
ncbi:MAG: Stk1 family PASTA domain-containing Ser/Thr kinase [Oscillospiraceae bacterium]|nr:Stk1 family PASTA domain-containing Ser/Thr kinase [Oscillospiraceae bacterium]